MSVKRRDAWQGKRNTRGWFRGVKIYSNAQNGVKNVSDQSGPWVDFQFDGLTVSAVICMSLRRVWHLCNFQSVNFFFKYSVNMCLLALYMVYCCKYTDIIVIFVGFILLDGVKQKPEIRQCSQATSDVLASRESYASLETFLCFLHQFDRGFVSRSMFRSVTPLFGLALHDWNVTVCVKVC